MLGFGVWGLGMDFLVRGVEKEGSNYGLGLRV